MLCQSGISWLFIWGGLLRARPSTRVWMRTAQLGSLSTRWASLGSAWNVAALALVCNAVSTTAGRTDSRGLPVGIRWGLGGLFHMLGGGALPPPTHVVTVHLRTPYQLGVGVGAFASQVSAAARRARRPIELAVWVVGSSTDRVASWTFIWSAQRPQSKRRGGCLCLLRHCRRQLLQRCIRQLMQCSSLLWLQRCSWCLVQ